MDEIITNQQALEADFAPNDAVDNALGCGRRLQRIDRREHHMRRHCRRQVVQLSERLEIGPLQLVIRCLNDRQLEVAVDPGPAVARDMFDDRQHTGVDVRFSHNPGQMGNHADAAVIGSGSNDIVGAGNGPVGTWDTVCVDAERTQVTGG